MPHYSARASSQSIASCTDSHVCRVRDNPHIVRALFPKNAPRVDQIFSALKPYYTSACSGAHPAAPARPFFALSLLRHLFFFFQGSSQPTEPTASSRESSCVSILFELLLLFSNVRAAQSYIQKLSFRHSAREHHFPARALLAVRSCLLMLIARAVVRHSTLSHDHHTFLVHEHCNLHAHCTPATTIVSCLRFTIANAVDVHYILHRRLQTCV